MKSLIDYVEFFRTIAESDLAFHRSVAEANREFYKVCAEADRAAEDAKASRIADLVVKKLKEAGISSSPSAGTGQ